MAKSKKLGRPEIQEPTKQVNVRMRISKLSDERLIEKTKYMSFSQYVNSLIDSDLQSI